MKNFLKVQAKYCLIGGLFCLALTPGFAQEPTTKNPNTTTPTTAPSTTTPTTAPNTAPTGTPADQRVKAVPNPDVAPSLKSPSDTIKPGERISPDNTRTRVNLDTIKPGERIGQRPMNPPAMVSVADAQAMVRAWPETARMAAEATIAKYGQPTLATDDMIMWKGNGPWKKTVVSREETQHDFPKAHKDVLEQTIYYKVPVEFFDDLARFDGSVHANRTKGTLSARCDKEAFNFLALNLAHEIITGKRTVESARTFLAQTVNDFMAGKQSTYTGGLLFQPQAEAASGDPDKMATATPATAPKEIKTPVKKN